MARSGSVRFRVRFRPVPELHGSVRPVRFGSVRFLIPSCHCCRQVRAEDPVACTVTKVRETRKRASRTHSYSATPSCAIMHAQAHAPVPHPCVFYPCDNDNNKKKKKNDNNRKDTVRFDSFRFQTFRKLIGSVPFGSEIYVSGSTRFGLRFSDTPWLGPVRFGSVPRPVPACSGIKRFRSAGSVRFLIPSCYIRVYIIVYHSCV